MKVFVLSETNSIANHFIAELRDTQIQNNRERFRNNMTKLGEVLGYELSKTLTYEPIAIQTPLGQAASHSIQDEIVLATILRAGLPLYQGFLNMFPNADSAFIGAYRSSHVESTEKVSINMDYMATPELSGKTLILIDPMLATGKSLVDTYNTLITNGLPKKVYIVAAIASKVGVEYVQDKVQDACLWLGVIDEILNNNAYIVPGLGDAGDLSFGAKL